MTGDNNNNGTKQKQAPSMALRWGVNIISLAGVFFFSGIIFGWAPLQLTLLHEERQYSNVCPDPLVPCDEQITRLGAIFTVGQFFLSFASLPVGFLLDSLPKNIYFFIAGVINVAGLLLFAYSDTTSVDRDYFQLAYSFMALGGCMAMLGGFPPSFLLPKYQAAILASLSCFFDASSIFFFVFYKIIVWLEGEGYEPIYIRQRLFELWAMLAVVIFSALVIFWTILERTDWKTELITETDASSDQDEDGDGEHNNHHHDDPDEQQALLQSSMRSLNLNTSLRPSPMRIRKQSSTSLNDHKLRRTSHRIQELQTKSFLNMLCTYDFTFCAVFAGISMLRCNFFILVVDNFLYNLGDLDATYASIFSLMLPAGLLFVPFIDGTHHHFGVMNTLRVTNAAGLVFGALLLVPQLSVVQVINFLVFTMYRAYLYSTISTLVAETFGLEPMGRVIGSTYFAAAVVSLLQVPMSVTTQTVFHGDYFPVHCFNLFLAMIPVLGLELYDRWEKRVEQQRRHREMSGTRYGTVAPWDHELDDD